MLFEMGENCVLQAAEQKSKVTEQEVLYWVVTTFVFCVII